MGKPSNVNQIPNRQKCPNLIGRTSKSIRPLTGRVEYKIKLLTKMALVQQTDSGSDGSSCSLLPCPFCGKQAEIRPNQKNIYKQTRVVIGCFNAQCLIAPSAVCYYKPHSQKTGLRWAIAKIAHDWNTRENVQTLPTEGAAKKP